jgi:hypothetical protein
LVAGRETDLSFAISDAATGRPADLEPFLGAPGHLLVMSADLVDAIHSHPDTAGARGQGPEAPSKITFPVRFPRPGPFRMWLQVQRRGQVVTVPFTVDVKAPGESVD